MPETKNSPDSPADGKHNTGAKIGVAFAFGSVGAKLCSPLLLLDLNALLPKGLTTGEKIKTTFSREILRLAWKQADHYMQKGHDFLTASVLATKWYSAASTVAMIGLGTVGWMRADRIENSSDIVKHPITSTKILLGMEEPKEKAPGQHTAKLMAQRDQQPSEIQR
ncbi:MAG: hypothetical protein DI582_00830 [Azospirillum brasilense]|nr:MAG: hypothetical protein DI582_00830 [Azospirillum brasilense]